eukprot:Rmarinus@m.13557
MVDDVVDLVSSSSDESMIEIIDFETESVAATAPVSALDNDVDADDGDDEVIWLRRPLSEEDLIYERPRAVKLLGYNDTHAIMSFLQVDDDGNLSMNSLRHCFGLLQQRVSPTVAPSEHVYSAILDTIRAFKQPQTIAEYVVCRLQEVWVQHLPCASIATWLPSPALVHDTFDEPLEASNFSALAVAEFLIFVSTVEQTQLLQSKRRVTAKKHVHSQTFAARAFKLEAADE